MPIPGSAFQDPTRMAPELKKQLETPTAEDQQPGEPRPKRGVGARLLAVVDEIMFSINQVPAQVKPNLVNPELRELAGGLIDQVGIPIGNTDHLSPRTKTLLFAGTILGYGALAFLNSRQFRPKRKTPQPAPQPVIQMIPEQEPEEERASTNTDGSTGATGREGEADR